MHRQVLAVRFLLTQDTWEDSQYLTVHLRMPKFDMASDLDLSQGLQSLGVTDVFDSHVSDFTPTTTQTEELYISQANHAARVMVDEEGCTAASYTVLAVEGAGMPPEEEVDFTLDRPFLFCPSLWGQFMSLEGTPNLQHPGPGKHKPAARFRPRL